MREGLLLHSGSVITHQLLERLVQAGGGQAADHAGQDGAGIAGGPVGPAGVGDCLRFAVGDEHPDEGHAVGAKFQVYGAPFRQNCRFAVKMPFVWT